MFHHDSFDLLLLDWLMPELSGIEVLQMVRESGGRDLPIIMLTCRSADTDIVEGLNSGADDFVVKPVCPEVLVARVNSLLRRLQPIEDHDNASFVAGIYTFHPASTSVTFHDKTAVLTNREFSLAKLFFTNPHRAFSRHYLIERLWGKSPDMETRTLDTHVARIRTKLDLRRSNGVKLATLYGYGYRLETSEADMP